ncbi:MAG: hypothetical protein ACRD0L_01260, partial [Acidimicrobiales bacterium]
AGVPGRGAGVPRRAGAPSGRVTAPKTYGAARRVEKAGRRLALDLWEGAVSGRRWAPSATAPGSPLAALYRIYGPSGPLRAIGLTPGMVPDDLMTIASLPCSTKPALATTGCLHAEGLPYPYTLRWQFGPADKPVVAEVLGLPEALDLVLPRRLSPFAALRLGLGHLDPPSGHPLDPVGSALWEHEPPRYGLAFAVRCIAAWWRARESASFSGENREALAAGLARLVGRRSGLGLSNRDAGQPYGADQSTTQRVAAELEAVLGPTAGLDW